MALGKYSRVDNKKSSGCCSTVTIVGFVALCLVGVWMLTSSSVVPIENSEVSSSENKNDISTKAVVSDSNKNNGTGNNSTDTSANDNKSKQFEDNSGDLPAGATNEDANNQQEEISTYVDNGKSTEGNEEEKETEVKKEDGESRSDETGETTKEEGESKANNIEIEEGKSDADGASEEASNEPKSDTEEGEKKSEESLEETQNEDKGDGQIQEKVDEKKDDDSYKGSDTETSNEVYPAGAQSELLNETTTQSGSFSTQAAESKNSKEGQGSQTVYNWKVCDTSAGPDYIPCLDNMEAIRHLTSTKHYEHRERHCPENPPTCLVPLPEGYQRSIEWPTSREKIWYHNVPHTKLAEVKGHQNWVKVSGEHLIFPGGGTQFKNGALHYIDFIQQSVPDLAWGKRSRVVLDVGCGVASLGGFLFDRDVLTMSLAPKDEHEAQVQFALERGIPAISAVMGTKRLPYPGRVFDIVHCARCRVPWHIEGGKLLLELNRLLRPGGYFVWSATPVYQKLDEDVEIWEAMKKLTKAMCWEVVSITKDTVNGVGIAIYQKPTSNECYEQRQQNDPPLCSESDDPDAAWNVTLRACMHKIPVSESARGSQWPEMWPARVAKTPYWLSSSQTGVYGKPAPEDFAIDSKHWKRVVEKSYLKGMGINWSTVRNVMDMRVVYGGLAAVLKEMNVWVMNVVSIDSPDTLPIIYERGLFGIYHDWCESFSTYPRTYDLLHADHLFSKIKAKCNYMAFIAEVDRLLRPEGKIIVRDTVETITELENMFKSMNWEIRMTFSKDNEGLLCAMKTKWRPNDSERVTYAIA
ncbi:hypothetical protein Leryth_027155 [Lithospermum erythrorhizon]|nr:hypothetical protein Leryth_027155 [Lithospermum erythrorhizon]